ncbi:hypothetical protein LCGC14_2508880 [marine sediment metagenome]|uniref:Uncharacterized protein n=1 Tax=marine sediment metagenome TaxID=412755 RepID=A0A0F9BMM1_9ZZZZ
MQGETDQTRWRGVRPIAGIRGVWPAIDSTRVNKQAIQTGSGNSIVYTVPSGKILFISGCGLSTSLSSSAGVVAYCATRDDGDTTVDYLMFHQMEIAGQIATFQRYSPAIELLADWDMFVLTNGANIITRALIFGWLEDA